MIGIVQSVAEFYLWAIAQLQILQQLARDTITATYYVLKRMEKERQEYVEHVKQQLPNYLSYRLQFLEEKWMATKLWNSDRKVHITKDMRRVLYRIYAVLRDKPHLWETPIAHVIKREEFMISTQDASHMAIGVAIPKRKMWLFIPYSKKTWHRVKLSQKNKRNIHINSLEAIAITFAFLMFSAD